MSGGAPGTWTTLGNLASPCRSIVDGRGLVTPWGEHWSLDWWIGGDDSWHLASSSTRQRLISLCPVVETVVGIPGGEAVHRVYAVRASGRSDELLVVEVENQSRAPFALGLLLSGDNPKLRFALVDRTATIDGRPALYLPAPPPRWAVSGSGPEEVAAAGSGAWERLVPGSSAAALVFPLVHTATLRVAIPTRPPRPRWGRLSVRQSLPPPAWLPAAADVARAWQAQTRRGLRVELPAGRLADAVEANRRFLLLGCGGCRPAAGASWVAALDRWGFHAEAAEVLAGHAAHQRPNGRFSGSSQVSTEEDLVATGAVLWAMGQHHRLTGDADMVRPAVGSIAAAARWIERARHGRRSRHSARRTPEQFCASSFWALKGLMDSAELLDAVGEEAAAATAASWAATFRADMDAALAPRPHGWAPAVAESVAMLAACSPLGLYPPAHPAMDAAAAAIRAGSGGGPGVVAGGLLPCATLRLASVELLAGDRRALDRLQWVVGTATDTFGWPEDMGPEAAGGDSGHGHRPAPTVGVTGPEPPGGANAPTTAEFCLLVRNLLVSDAPHGLAVCTMLPGGWIGHGLEVHDAPTTAGPLSFALRWHGERPALLWELKRRRASPVRLTAPGLDPLWSSTEPAGEALLAPMPAVALLRGSDC